MISEFNFVIDSMCTFLRGLSMFEIYVSLGFSKKAKGSCYASIVVLYNNIYVGEL